MSNNYFKFKQFAVFQDHCAMKVGTDGVLLGAWTQVAGRSNILDVGTGTGLIALMLAQRNLLSMIDAIDIDKDCVAQAQQNVSRSPFAKQIHVEKNSFQDFAQQTNKKYDLIVSNPPYFQNALQSPNSFRNFARHNVTLSFFEIITQGSSLLSDEGHIALILPHEFMQPVLDCGAKLNLFANRITHVFSLPGKPAKRLLVEFRKNKTECVVDDLVIELSRHQYSVDFKALTKDFYLKE